MAIALITSGITQLKTAETQITLTTTVAIPAGSMVIYWIARDSTLGTFSMQDSVGNIYTTARSSTSADQSATSVSIFTYVSYTTIDIPVNGTFTTVDHSPATANVVGFFALSGANSTIAEDDGIATIGGSPISAYSIHNIVPIPETGENYYTYTIVAQESALTSFAITERAGTSTGQIPTKLNQIATSGGGAASNVTATAWGRVTNARTNYTVTPDTSSDYAYITFLVKEYVAPPPVDEHAWVVGIPL